MKIWNVSVEAGAAHDNLAVHADDEDEARTKARSAGYSPTAADVYEISSYGVRFCVRELGAPPEPSLAPRGWAYAG